MFFPSATICSTFSRQPPFPPTSSSSSPCVATLLAAESSLGGKTDQCVERNLFADETIPWFETRENLAILATTIVVAIPRLSSGIVATSRQVPREVGQWREFHVEEQGSFTTWLQWIKNRCIFIDSSSGQLELAQELTRGAIADIPAETPAHVRTTLTSLASRETLFATYLRQAQSLEATTSLMGRDDVVDASLADWLDSNAMTLFPRFLA